MLHMTLSSHLPIAWCSSSVPKTFCTSAHQWSVRKFLLNSLKVEMVLGAILLNYTLANPLSVVGKTLHIISYGTPYRYIRVLNDYRWSNRSFGPSYASTYGIRNLAGRGKEVICVVKGESVQWTSLPRSMDTHLFMAFIIIYILSFIICMSCTMCSALPFGSNQWLMSSCWSCLLATLLSSWFSLSWWSPIGGSLCCACHAPAHPGVHRDITHSFVLAVTPTLD